MAVRKRFILPPRTRDELQEDFPAYRQSLLSDADTCMLATKWRLERDGVAASERQWDSAEAARGVLYHRWAAEVLRTLWRTGNTQMPVTEGLELLYEVCRQRDVEDSEVVFIPARERRMLRMLVVVTLWNKSTGQLRPFNMARMLDVERRLFAQVSYPRPEGGDPVRRVITGQPDAVLADPPDGIVVLDWKTTPKAPAEAAPDDDGHDDPARVSYEGYFQQRVYALLVFANVPSAKRVTLREFYPLENGGRGASREAVILREDIERIHADLALDVELLDRALMGGSDSAMWKPQPGRHCRYCPRPGSCPIDHEARGMDGEGSLSSMAAAERYAAEMVVAKRVYDHRRGALKAYHDDTGHLIPVKDAKARYVLGWTPNKTGGGRSFRLHVPTKSDRGPEDASLTATFNEAAARRPKR